MTRWRLSTRSSHLDLEGRDEGLVVAQWEVNDRVGAPPRADRITPFVPEPDRIPWLLPTAGVVHLTEPDLLCEVDGVRGTGLRLLDVNASDHLLQAQLCDETGALSVLLTIESDSGHDVIRQQAHYRNAGDRTVTLTRASSGSWYVPTHAPVRVVYLCGAWAQEFTPARTTLGPGRFEIGSRAGITSHAFAPWAAIEAEGSTIYSFAFGWCGSWTLGVEAGFEREWARVSVGVPDAVTLRPGEEFTAPPSFGLCSDGDPSHAWHQFGRSMSRGLDVHHHPVVYNSWYATGFDVRADQQIALAERAARLGVEVFVVDDGWFRGRTSDKAGLGDWAPEPSTFPDGLDPLVSAVRERGMRFGLWVEPEGVNPDSDLFRAHPDWVYGVPGRERYSARHQYVLDFGREDVVAWTKDWLRTLLRSTDITFLKWDMNRVITDTGSHPPDWAYRHAQGYLEVMAMLREEFPHVTIEACSGGGGRVDWSVLPLCDVVWASDETGPRDRLAIQHGFTRAFPASVMSSWVTDMADQVDVVPVSLQFRCLVAMGGVFGVGCDLTRMDANATTVLAEAVTRYREIRPTVLAGELSWHGAPADPACAAVYSDNDRSVVMAFRRGDAALTITTPHGEVCISWDLAADCDLVVVS